MADLSINCVLYCIGLCRGRRAGWINPEDSFVLTINAAEIITSNEWSAGVTLRFPRIKKIRAEGFGEDAKPVDQVETVESLQELYHGRQQQKVALGSQGSQILGSQNPLTATDIETSFCRFLTEEQNAKKRPSRRKQAFVAPEVKASRIPTPPSSKCSKILQGFTFTILDGIYHLEACNFDKKQAEEQGWQDRAQQIRCREDFIRFVQKHSGECILSGNALTDFVVGGKQEDARVSNYRRAIEAVSLDNEYHKSQKGLNIRKMAHLGGVVKWTFVIAAVHRAIKEAWAQKIEQYDKVKEEAGMMSNLCNLTIKEQFPELLRPTRYDYLVLSKVAKDALLCTEDEYGIHLWEDSNIIDFKRALGEVGRGRKINKFKTRKRDDKNVVQPSNLTPWQYRAISSLDDSEQWIFSGKRQKLWPHHSSSMGDSIESSKFRIIQLYPDLFGDNLGIDDTKQASSEVFSAQRWKQVLPSRQFGAIASSLPLVKAMGAQVTPHLHCGVTHVLCDVVGRDIVRWKSALPMDFFGKEGNGRHICRRLLALSEIFDSFSDRAVFLVSPQWARKQWEK